jgi:hypothetical protein
MPGIHLKTHFPDQFFIQADQPGLVVLETLFQVIESHLCLLLYILLALTDVHEWDQRGVILPSVERLQEFG